MEPFRDVAEALQKEFSEDDEVQGVIAREQSLCEQWALENVVEDQSPEPRSLTIGEQEPQHAGARGVFDDVDRSEEHTSELQSLMRISYAVFCLKKKKSITQTT